MSNIIYRPKGAAAEYSLWGVNIYSGCTHRCDYCYNRRGIWAGTLGQDKPVILKKAGGSILEASNRFSLELNANREAIIRDGGIFFSFTTDPMLPATIGATRLCMKLALKQGVPVQILTKATWWYHDKAELFRLYQHRNLVKIGFTLTGHDELEPGAPSNMSRIEAMEYIAGCGIPVFASIEPVIDFASSLEMIYAIVNFCPEIRIGLLSPYSTKRYDAEECSRFFAEVNCLAKKHDIRVLYKESFRRFLKEKVQSNEISKSA